MMLEREKKPPSKSVDIHARLDGCNNREHRSLSSLMDCNREINSRSTLHTCAAGVAIACPQSAGQVAIAPISSWVHVPARTRMLVQQGTRGGGSLNARELPNPAFRDGKERPAA